MSESWCLKRCLLVILVLLSLLIFARHVSARESQYQIFAVTGKDSYNAGENVSIQVIFDGLGKITYGKFFFYAPAYIVQNQKITETEQSNNVCVNATNLNQQFSNLFGNPKDGICCVPNGFVSHSFTNGFSMEMDSPMLQADCDTDVILGTFQLNGLAPVNIKFKLEKNAPSGTHPLYLSFIYKQDNQTYMSYYVATIKIRAWYEKEYIQKWVMIALALTIIASLVAIFKDAIIPLFVWIWNLLKKSKPELTVKESIHEKDSHNKPS